MKKIFTLTILLYFGSYFCYGQKYQKAVVTDVNYFIRYDNRLVISPLSSNLHFPLYFHFPEFIADIYSDILKLTKERFHADTVIFLYPDSVNITKDRNAPAVKARDTARKYNENDAVFISVETILQKEAGIYNFTTRVKAYSKRGKKVYDFTNHIPFECYSGEEISGTVLMSEDDFYAFYFDGLDLAFKGKTKRTDKRYVQQPHTSYYDVFLNECEKFYLIQKEKGYAYGRNYENMAEVLNFTNIWYNPDYRLNMSTIIYNSVVKNRFNIHNKFTNEDFLIGLKGDGNTIFDFLSAYSNIIFTINTKDNKSLGNFIYDHGKLKAELQGKPYVISWNKKFDVAEMTAANQPMALMKYLDNGRVIYIKNSLSEEQLGDLFNLIFIYDFAHFIQQVIEY